MAWIFRIISLNLVRLLDNTCLSNEGDKDIRAKLFTRVCSFPFNEPHRFLVKILILEC